MAKEILVNIGPVDDIPLGQGLCFKLNEEEIAVFRLRNGKVVAIENRCPHRQGPLADGIIDEDKVVCPLHGHKFNLSTGKGSEGAECIKVYKAWIENGKVIIRYLCAKEGSVVSN